MIEGGGVVEGPYIVKLLSHELFLLCRPNY